MPRDDVTEVIARLLREECGVDRPLCPELRLAEDLGLDSVGMLSLALGLENHYRVALEEDPEAPPRTLGELETLVRRRLE